MTVLRLIHDEHLKGPDNMARDEALLDAVGAGASPPTVRFYGWSPPTISLGYFQAFDDYLGLDEPARALAVVRRTTGGGAILHDREVTYSVTLPLDHDWMATGPNSLYERFHNAVIACAGPATRMAGCSAAPGACGNSVDAADAAPTDTSSSRHGPFFCFARRHRYDVVVTGPAGVDQGKLAGSAQRRSRRAVLQHGSIILSSRFAQQPCATWDALEPALDHRAAVERLAASLQRMAGCQLRPGPWTGDELAAAGRLHEKYSSDAWTRMR